jgi:hypothetical protein
MLRSMPFAVGAQAARITEKIDPDAVADTPLTRDIGPKGYNNAHGLVRAGVRELGVIGSLVHLVVSVAEACCGDANQNLVRFRNRSENFL